MKCPSIPPAEAERLRALAEYGLGSGRPLPSLDSVVRIAKRMFGMPAAAVNMIGSDHVFFAASIGVGQVDMSRDVSFCAHAITQAGVMVVADAASDERFHDNPLVTGPARIRFYAGVPLLSPEGHALGALCVVDSVPHRDFSEEDRERLSELAQIASDRLELRRIELSAERSSAVPKDKAERRAEADELQRLDNIDILTGLPSRGRFYRLVEQALSQGLPAAVLMVGLDGFKDVNNALGHAVGDGILCEVAGRLQICVGAEGSVARIGGDEFAVLLPGVGDVARASMTARKVNGRIALPMSLDGQEVHIAASCGVALSPLHGLEPMELIGNADLALFKAKSSERGRFFVFFQGLRQEAAARRLHGLELHRAVVNGEFILFYQPQVRLTDGVLTGAEALLRWRHPQREILSPAAFLPALEAGPLAATVGAWVLDEACAQAALWRRCGAESLRIGVNLFGAQFRVGDLAAEVIETLERHGLPPEALELEITENIVLDEDGAILEAMRRLRRLGIGIAFDDFGTGFGSLKLLKRYPLSRVKIDQSFVQGMPNSKQDASVVRAVLDMARSFDLETIAEGVETEIQRRDLLREGCGEGQGYLFGRPMPARQFAETFGIAPPARPTVDL